MATAIRTKWTIDTAHSEVRFKVKHLVISTVTGYFREFEGYIESEGEGWEGAKAEFFAKTNSIDTNQKDRDTHLRSDDFFNAEQYPDLHFVSTEIKKTSGNEYQMTGDLTIRDVTKKVTLSVDFLGEVKDPYGQQKAAFEITGTINRKEFGLKWTATTEAGGLVVSDEVKLQLDIQVVKQAAA